MAQDLNAGASPATSVPGSRAGTTTETPDPPASAAHSGLPGREVGDIIAIGTRPVGASGRIHPAEPPRPGEPTLRWHSRAHSIESIEQEIARIWSEPNLMVDVDGAIGRHVAARTSVMNLVVVARQPEVGERAAETINRLTGRHPSRTLVVLSADPDGPSWLDARVQAHCVLPRADAPETCAEMIFLTAGGETGRHLGALVAPLLIHDLPVAVWWPGEPPLGAGSGAVAELLESAERLVVDASAWSGDGLARLRELSGLYERFDRLAIRDFALVRQSRWREAIASVFDLPAFLPYLSSLRRISVTYSTHDETGAPGSTNVVKPIYHVAWLASRLGMRVTAPLAALEGPRRPAAGPRTGDRPGMHRGLHATLKDRAHEVAVFVRPFPSTTPPGTTLRIELLAERRGSELRADVTAEAENVLVHAWLDGVQALDRTFKAARRSDVDLLSEALEVGGRDPLAVGAIRTAAELVGPGT